MLLHAMRHWPDIVSTLFWPFAFSYATLCHNVTPRRGRDKCPYEEFTGETPSVTPDKLRVFGIPAYVLSKEIQVGNPTGKFSKERSYLGVFVGFSDNHAGTVPLIFNQKTKLVSP